MLALHHFSICDFTVFEFKHLKNLIFINIHTTIDADLKDGCIAYEDDNVWKKKTEQNERLKSRRDGEAREPSGREVGEG